MRTIVLAVAAILIGSGFLHADLHQARTEANLEKRAKLALDDASAMLEAARQAYQKEDETAVAAAVAELQESVDLAFSSLNDTHKDPRRSPKWFKYAEIHTRALLRKLDVFQQDMSFQDRSSLDKVKEDIQRVHDQLLVGLMEGKPK